MQTEFKPHGRHVEGGGDYFVIVDGTPRGILCHTIDANDVWRARYVEDSGRINRRYESADVEDVFEWVRRLLENLSSGDAPR